MGIFFEKPVKGPDVVGGIWPIMDRGKFHNRTGRTVSKGDVLTLAWTSGEATEVATNTTLNYVPGGNSNTVWNTVIDPVTNTVDGSSRNRGGCFIIATDASVADNGVVNGVAFGIVSEAYVVSSTTIKPGDPLTPTITNSLRYPVGSHETIVATYMGPSDASITVRELKRVLLHQGLFAPHNPSPATTG